MLLSRIPQKETTEKFSVTFRTNTLHDLQKYREFVISKAGVDVGRGDLMEQIILDFFERDREFQRFKAAVAAGNTCAPSLAVVPAEGGSGSSSAAGTPDGI